MALHFFNQDHEQFDPGDTFRPFINGYAGGSHEEIIYIRNDSALRWFSNVRVSVVSGPYDAEGELGASGFSFKFMYGERRPTEAEWDSVESGAALELPDIGDVDAADTSSFVPFWLRCGVPGGTAAQINESFTIRLSCLPRLVN